MKSDRFIPMLASGRRCLRYGCCITDSLARMQSGSLDAAGPTIQRDVAAFREGGREGLRLVGPQLPGQ